MIYLIYIYLRDKLNLLFIKYYNEQRRQKDNLLNLKKSHLAIYFYENRISNILFILRHYILDI